MNLPTVITALVTAQRNYDSLAYANCFTADATVSDEGKTFTGRSEIEGWIAAANKKYNTVMKPLEYKKMGNGAVLTTENSGTFPGSPIILKYHLTLKDGLIMTLKITV